jgi:phenylacetate-CoA ligase
MIVRGINIFPNQIEEQVLRCEGLTPHYLIELRRDGRLDVMRVLTEARPTHAADGAREAEARRLGSHIRDALGVSVEVVVGTPGAIERSAGKAKRINDLRSKL